MKRCSKCKEEKPATAEYFGPEKRVSDGFQSQCRECYKAYRAVNREKDRERHRKYYAANRERGHARGRKYSAVNPEKVRESQRKYRIANREKVRERDREYCRREWQRMGSGIHMARVQDWRDFFDSLDTDTERTIAAHVMLTFAPLDRPTQKVVQDHSFDFNYIAPYAEEAA